MKRVRSIWSQLSLKKAYILTVFLSVCLILLLSAITIAFCLWGRHYLLPGGNDVYLMLEKEYSDGTKENEILLLSMEGEQWKAPVDAGFSVERGDNVRSEEDDIVITRYSIHTAKNAFHYLTPKRKLAYRILSVGMIVMPVVYVILGILLSAVWFYRHKLSLPIQKLDDAIAQIRQQNLDFSIESVSGDELGQVCASFEEMRKTLYENNHSLWNMLEERKRLQASVAHDLRNPITIIQTYAEYLKLNLEKETLEKDSFEKMIENLRVAAKRLEQYTDSIRDISKLEEIEVHPESVNLNEILPEMVQELELLAEKEGKELMIGSGEESVFQDGNPMIVKVDISVLYRILENLVTNASRYAKKTIRLYWAKGTDCINLVVSDDGAGFPAKVLNGRKTYFVTTDADSGHLGMGLSICRILCRKLGGRIRICNMDDGGAKVKISLSTN